MTLKKILATLFAAALMLSMAPFALAEQAPGYNYSFWGEPNPAPAAYVVDKTLYGEDIGAGKLSSPQDLYVAADGKMYLADTGNNRIVVMDDQFRMQAVLREFDNNGKQDSFNQPEGVFAAPNGDIYVADTQNRRIVVLTAEGRLIRQFGLTESPLIRSVFQYTPTKVVADKAGQVYVISRGSYEGIMEFDSDGIFQGFIGTNRVKFDPIDLLWKRISTKAQREQMAQFIPTEFNNVAIEPNGFMYTTTSEEMDSNPIKRLNISGIDVLRSKGYFDPRGDVKFSMKGSRPGSSIFVDVAPDEAGMYSALDSKRGRIFTYDKDGNLLYVFGGLGSQQGLFRTPVAIGMLGERTLILDRDLARLTVFRPTEYGLQLRSAVRNIEAGKADQSTAAWKQVLKMNSNFEVAYIGIGKSLLKQGDNKEAMKYFKLGNNREYYSEAFKRYRQEVVFDNFGYIAGGVILIVVLIYGALKLAKRRTAGAFYQEVGVLKNPFYTMLHPYKGFWEMKFEQKGRVKVAFLILLLLALFSIIKRQFSGFVVNYNNLADFNSLNEFKFVLLPFVLWVIANWSITTLMEGEGKFKEIIMATGYALMPMVIVALPQTLYSNIITIDEGSFYHLLETIAYVWSVWLLFVGTMTVHQYTPGKTVVTMLLTLVVIGIILFLGLLFFSMIQQMVSFVISLYHEIGFRL
ncbi:YIP1 family protein [Paenibacillus thermotolerans]|uniref:YIP1 family protein n=1 Tax=Paenibacillus thermotolerans TaxID=3027807 RepID=UPI002367EC9F|nr:MULTISPECIES: YIP1 family protein [unclassified Paenibacillus]